MMDYLTESTCDLKIKGGEGTEAKTYSLVGWQLLLIILVIIVITILAAKSYYQCKKSHDGYRD